MVMIHMGRLVSEALITKQATVALYLEQSVKSARFQAVACVSFPTAVPIAFLGLAHARFVIAVVTPIARRLGLPIGGPEGRSSLQDRLAILRVVPRVSDALSGYGVNENQDSPLVTGSVFGTGTL